MVAQEGSPGQAQAQAVVDAVQALVLWESLCQSLPPSLPLWMAAIDVFACENMHAHTHTHTHMTACVQTHTHSLGGGRRGVLVRARNGMSLIAAAAPGC